MKKRSYLLLAVLAAIAVSVSAVSAFVPPAGSHALVASVQTQLSGGVSCDGALGLTGALALGALTPCSIMCAVGAWYSLALIAYAC